MTVQYLNIEEKHRMGPGDHASLRDFTVSAGDTTGDEHVLLQPNVSLYCLDDAARRAIFVELPDGIDLSTAPFVYSTQYEQAQRLIAVPYDRFRELARQLPPVERLILIYISGRSGSTLLSHVLNEFEGVLSLSEPDVANQFVHLRDLDGSRDAELRDLLDCTVRMLAKPTPFKTPNTFALKFRSETLQVMDLYQAAFPQAKNLYLYRDAIGFAASFYRVFMKAGFADHWSRREFVAAYSAMMRYDFERLAALVDPDVETLSTPQQLAIWWLAIMEWYLAQHTRGIPVQAVRYADLTAHREQVVTSILEYCGLPTDQVAKSLQAFERDSQAGTFLARDKPNEGNTFRFSEAQLAEITEILARHPVIKESDFIVPGTLRV
jgi:hypothetical protein